MGPAQVEPVPIIQIDLRQIPPVWLTWLPYSLLCRLSAKSTFPSPRWDDLDDITRVTHSFQSFPSPRSSLLFGRKQIIHVFYVTQSCINNYPSDLLLDRTWTCFVHLIQDLFVRKIYYNTRLYCIVPTSVCVVCFIYHCLFSPLPPSPNSPVRPAPAPVQALLPRTTNDKVIMWNMHNLKLI